jgi:branched-subunit amino acid transport protein
MTELQVWLALLGLGACTCFSRSAALFLPERVQLPGWLVIGLRYAPMAALAAVIAPQFLAPAGELALALDNARWMAGLAGILAWWLWRNLLAVLATGTATYFLASWVLGV